MEMNHRLFILILLLLFLYNISFSQVSYKYLINKGYHFPVESSLAEIDSIERVRNSYSGTNDSLFLENTIYKFERLAFLPDSPRVKFDYLSFYKEIINIEIGNYERPKFTNNYYDEDNLSTAWIKVKKEIYNRLLNYYQEHGNSEEAYKYLTKRIKANISLAPILCGNYYEPHIGDQKAFEIILGLRNVNKFNDIYFPYLWKNFINPSEEYFSIRSLPYINLIQEKSTHAERLQILINAEESIECGDSNASCKMNFMNKEIYIHSNDLKNKTMDMNKKDKEKYVRNYFKNLKFYEKFSK